MIVSSRRFLLSGFAAVILFFSVVQQSKASEPACVLNTTERVSQPYGDTRRSKRVKAPASPLANFYSADAWEGSVATRLEKLVREVPELKVHKQVRFRYKGDNGVETFRTKTVLEVPNELSVEAKTKIHNAFSRGVVSFPVEEGGGHLYTRLGNKTFDQYHGFRTPSDSMQYVQSNTNYSSILEPIVALRSNEELRLRQYVKNVSDDSTKVLGRHNYQGSGPGDTSRTATSNAPLDPVRGHNCTSWICTSPVGEIDDSGKREAFITMTKAPLSDEIHTNPGWLNFHITGRVEDDRNPLVIFWPKAGDSIQSRIGAGEDNSFNWDFSLH